MAPLLRRSWGLKGHPPQSQEKAGHREKVSVAAALWLPPGRDRLALAFQTLANGYFNNEEVADFWRAAMAGTDGPVLAVWDGGTMHRGGPIRELLAELGGRLEFEALPPHAPELMPVEQVWTWLKYSRLCNFAPADARELEGRVFQELYAIRENQELLRSFFHASDLPLPRALLS